MKAKTITSCDNAFVTNLVLARDPAAAGVFLCESVAGSKMFNLCESVAAATKKRPVGTEINHTFW
jgi:hypothetical protein